MSNPKKETLEPKAPEIMQNLKWLWIHGRRYWIYVLFSAIILLIIPAYKLFSPTFDNNNKNEATIRPRMILTGVHFSKNNVNSVLNTLDKSFYTNFTFKNIGKSAANYLKMTIISTDDNKFQKIQKNNIKENINSIQPGQSFSEQRILKLEHIDLDGIREYFIKNNKNITMYYYYLKLEYGEDSLTDKKYCQEFWVETSLNKNLIFLPVLTSTKQTSKFQKLINNKCDNKKLKN